MASKKRYAVVFVYGLAKKPAPEKLKRSGGERSYVTIPRAMFFLIQTPAST